MTGGGLARRVSRIEADRGGDLPAWLHGDYGNVIADAPAWVVHMLHGMALTAMAQRRGTGNPEAIRREVRTAEDVLIAGGDLEADQAALIVESITAADAAWEAERPRLLARVQSPEWRRMVGPEHLIRSPDDRW